MIRRKPYIVNARKKLLSGIGVPEKVEFVPDDFQLEAIESLQSGTDTLVIAPTGAGKTYIAIEAIRAYVESGKRVVYTGPLKALSNSKFTEFTKLFSPGMTVGLLTGDRKIEGDSDIVVATTEIYRNELYNLRDTYGLVVLDEFHYLADQQRGPVWEESIILSSKESTLLMLSASISNAEEIAAWIEEVRRRPVRIVKAVERPVELRLAFLHPKIGVIPLEKKDGEVLNDVENLYASSSSVPPWKRRKEKGGENKGHKRHRRHNRGQGKKS